MTMNRIISETARAIAPTKQIYIPTFTSCLVHIICVCVCVCGCVRACVHACVRGCDGLCMCVQSLNTMNMYENQPQLSL